jgi:hypothetical protein
MAIYEWNVVCEHFVDGPERWYARHPEADIRLAASTLDELIARIWVVELGGTVQMITASTGA